MTYSKKCEQCGQQYFKQACVTMANWRARRYCSQSCAARGNSAKRKHHNRQSPTGELNTRQKLRLALHRRIVTDDRMLMLRATHGHIAATGYEAAMMDIVCEILTQQSDK